MMLKFKLNPVTKKRLQRFVSLKRAYWSFWMLVGLYAVSLVSELISNDKPLFVKFEGESYFPVFSFYPDDLFTGSGLNTRPDYKEVAKLPVFSENSSNYMIFAPIPYGPYETIMAERIEIENTTTVSFVKNQLIASINLDADLKLSRTAAAGALFGVEDERSLRGSSSQDFLEFPDIILEGIESRLANDSELEAVEETVVLNNGLKVKASMSAYRPRSRAPTSVRVTLREEIGDVVIPNLEFAEGASTPAESNDFWQGMETDSQLALLEGIKTWDGIQSREVKVVQFGKTFIARLDRETVKFPFRPVGDHIFGLDASGRDVFARILYALRISLSFGLALVISTMCLGVLIGGIQGYKGGMVDLAGQRVIEIWESLPFLYIMIFMGSVFGRSFTLLLVVYGIFNWIGISYYMRGEFLKLRAQPFVEAAHCTGLPGWKIMLRHILPNSIVPIVTFFPFYLVGAIFSLSALDYLGFGMPPPTPSWGELLSQAQEFKYAWWLVVYPTTALILVILLGVFIGEGVRAAFDPRVNSKFES